MDKASVLNVRGGARMAVPDTLGCLSTYILREQEDWFEDEIRFVRRWLHPGMQAVDVGANIGVYTIAMAQAVGSSGRVWAFEPTPAAADFLQRSVEINEFSNVIVSRAAVSDREGSIAFSVGKHSELNAVAQPGGDGDGVVQVRAVTVDQMAADHGWANVDLVKLDVEGHEFEALAGGRGFFGAHSPLVMFEIKADKTVDLRVLQPLKDLGYEFYRLLPGPLLLAPFNPAGADISDLLNVFACKPDRAERIARTGMLARSSAARIGTPSGEVWKSYLQRMPYARCMTGTSGGTKPSSDGSPAIYLEGLAAYAQSKAGNCSASECHAWLNHSLRCVGGALDAAPSLARRISYARIARDLAMRISSIQALATGPGDWEAGLQAALDEPFLAPLERHESAQPDGDGREWLRCCIVEQWEKYRSYSSMFLGDTSLQVIAPIRDLSDSPEMERRWQLVRMRSGMQAGPEPAAVLRQRSDENLNPGYWCAGTA